LISFLIEQGVINEELVQEGQTVNTELNIHVLEMLLEVDFESEAAIFRNK
jgi:hypothetical protein